MPIRSQNGLATFLQITAEAFFIAAVFSVPVLAADSAGKDETSFLKSTGPLNCKLTDSDGPTLERLEISLQAEQGLVKSFTSSWVVSSNSDDVRPGYASTCRVRLDQFRQLKKGSVILLKYQSSEAERDQKDCEIAISESRSSIRVRSSGCTYPCMNLDVAFDKATRSCKRVSRTSP